MTYRLFIDSELINHREVELSKEEERHLKVLRVHPQETIELVNGKGFLAHATLTDQKKLIIQHLEKAPPPPYSSTIIQAMTENSHLDFLFEKGCELGMTHFLLFPSQKSRKSTLSENKLQRLQHLLISALKQSKRLYLPTFSLFRSMESLPPLPNALYLADFEGTSLLSTPAQDTAFIIGPESGLTKEEIDYFVEKRKAQKVCLSPNVLRTETASIVAAFLLTQKES